MCGHQTGSPRCLRGECVCGIEKKAKPKSGLQSKHTPLSNDTNVIKTCSSFPLDSTSWSPSASSLQHRHHHHRHNPNGTQHDNVQECFFSLLRHRLQNVEHSLSRSSVSPYRHRALCRSFRLFIIYFDGSIFAHCARPTLIHNREIANWKKNNGILIANRKKCLQNASDLCRHSLLMPIQMMRIKGISPDGCSRECERMRVRAREKISTRSWNSASQVPTASRIRFAMPSTSNRSREPQPKSPSCRKTNWIIRRCNEDLIDC